MKSIILKCLKICGYELVCKPDGPNNFLAAEACPGDISILEMIREYTMTSNDRVWALINAVGYVIRADIPGDFVECGVWRGGSSMAMALKLKSYGADNRRIWLYDTFEGMTAPTEDDSEIESGILASELLRKTEDKKNKGSIWCYASLQDVKRNIGSTLYPEHLVTYVEGDVVETLSAGMHPEKIAILRLDTDWYESTKSELEMLYPKLQSGGVCIIDDYGHWAGARKAVDEYLQKNNIKVYMHQVDYSGRVFIKP